MNDVHFVSNEVLNSQHALILRCMANVSEYLFYGIKGQDLFELVDKLDAYCKLHFLDEEKMMEETNLIGIERHKSQHAMFIMRLTKAIDRIEELSCRNTIEELNFLKEWFLEHIVTFDKEYTERRFRLNETPTEPCH